MTTPEKSSGVGLGLFLLAVLGVLGAIGLFSNLGPPTPGEPPASAARPAAPPPAPAPDPFTQLTPTEHVAEAKKALAEWKPHKDPMKTVWGRVADADKHLSALPAEDRQRPDVVKLKREVDRRTTEIKRLANLAARAWFAQHLEQTYLQKGMDVYVSVHGADKTTLQLKYVLMSRPLMHQFANDTNTIVALREAGFTKVRLTNGDGYTWTFDL